jgi:hypothetical protein
LEFEIPPEQVTFELFKAMFASKSAELASVMVAHAIVEIKIRFVGSNCWA